MKRPSSLQVVAVVAGLLFLFAIVGALLVMPEGSPRVVYVNVGP